MVFEPTISAEERPQTYALDRAATGTGPSLFTIKNINQRCMFTAADGRELLVLQNGKIVNDIFLAWLTEFMVPVHPLPGGPVLLILDCHNSQKYLQITSCCPQ